MCAYWNGLGNELGAGLGDFARQFIGTQNTLQQQADQKAQQDRQYALQQQQTAEQVRQFDESQARLLARDQLDAETLDYNRQRLERQDGITGRESDLKNALAPAMKSFMDGVDNDKLRYGPTYTDKAGVSHPNPQYNKPLYDAAVGREKQANKLWQQAYLSVGTGEQWDEARSALIQFTGGDVSAAPQTPPPAPQPTAMPDMPRGAVLGNMEPGDHSPTSAPPPQALPPSITSIAPSQLMDMPDDQILATYGQGGMEYAIAARQEYAAQVQARQEADRKVRVDGWDVQYKELAKRTDLTADQRLAMATITTLMNRPNLTEEEAGQMTEAFSLLTPKMYDATSWQKVVDTKDPDAILAMLPVYQKYAPDVVAGFDPTGLQQARQDTHDKAAAGVALDESTAAKNRAATARDVTTLPYDVTGLQLKNDGEVLQQNIDWGKAQDDRMAAADKRLAASGERAATDAATDQTRQATGLKTLAGLASTQPGSVSMDSLQRNGPDPKNPAVGSTWATLKSQLGVNDQGLAAMLGEARYKYSLGLRGDELENKLSASKVLTDGALRGKYIVDTSMTKEQITTEIESRSVKIEEIRGRIDLAKKQGANYDSLVKERDRLVDEREQLLTAQTAAAQGSAAASAASAASTTALTPVRVAQGWASVAKVQADIKNDRERTAAYVQSVKNAGAVDVAQIAQMNANTALARAKNPNDPLYNPTIANSKPGDPINALTKKAGAFYTQSDQALKAAGALQSSINSLLSKGRTISGGFDQNKLTPDEQAKYTGLITQRDALLGKAAGFRQQGDDVLTNGMQKLPAGSAAGTSYVVPGPKSPPSAPVAPGVPTGSVTGQGGVVYSGGGAQTVQSLLPPAEITKQITMTTDHYLGKIRQQGGNRNPWDNAAGPVRAYNGLRPTADNQLRYVNDVKAAYDAKPWVQAINDATGQRKVELRLIDSEADRIAKARGVDPNVIKAIMWQESMGWQPGIPSSDGKGGGLGQVTGYFPPRPSTYSGASPRPATSGPQPGGAAAPAISPASPATAKPASPTGFKSNPQLEAGLRAAVINSDGGALNQYGAELMKAGYTQAQVQTLIKRYQGGS